MEYVNWIDYAIHQSLMKLVLGSESPRRKELLSTLGYMFRTLSPNADEIIPDGISITEVPIELAQLKASILMSQLHQNEIVICADTIVALDNQIFGINFIDQTFINTCLDVFGIDAHAAGGVGLWIRIHK